MPFGATPSGGGKARFRLWAPAAREVELELDGRIAGAVRPAADGWCEFEAAAMPGARYRYRIDGGTAVPDPASRSNPDGVHGHSELIDPDGYRWSESGWRGRPWNSAVIYELHVGTFSAEGTFAGVESRLDELAALGITAIELMPVAAFPGQRNWGYDGVLPFAPAAAYGRPEDLKRLVDAAHARGLMMLLDVVYNHLGPEGNYLHLYASDFFTERHHTPWGAAINFDGAGARPVRDFFIHNALYWLEEFHFDGLRLDAVHSIFDDSATHVLDELALTVRRGLAADRHIHLVLENDRNEARRLERDADGRSRHYDAQWNDDFHHAMHVAITGETHGYYADYAGDPATHLARCLAEGYDYQGEPSPYRGRETRGEPSAHLPPAAFISFLQNHDQVGNRACGERLTALVPENVLRPATAAWLLAPQVPMLFMGEEFGAATPFLFFCDFGPELAAAVTAGRRREFADFAAFRDADTVVPDPNSLETFERSKLAWTTRTSGPHAGWLAFYRELLDARRRYLVPLLPEIALSAATYAVRGAGAFTVTWNRKDRILLFLLCNLHDGELEAGIPDGLTLMFCEPRAAGAALATGRVPAFTTAWYHRP